MKKRVLPVFMTLLIAVSAAACSSAPASESSSPSPAATPIVESSMAEEPTLAPSPEPAADTAEEEALISAIMESELGETAPVTITAVEEPHVIEGTDSSLYSVDFTAGDRELQAAFTMDETGEKELAAISKADDGLHYYYYKDADIVNSFGVVMVHLYDYNTDEEIVSGDSQATSSYSLSSETSAAAAPTSQQSAALSTALDYLDFTAFSHSGLVDQLEYEGFSTEDATWAADNCGADWDQQALQSAKDYLDFTAFSYSGLIDQLEYEGFTTEQATYGVDNCGADWMEQAALCAQEYLDYSEFSRQGLIDQLEFEGFTAEQAQYGVTQAGM